MSKITVEFCARELNVKMRCFCFEDTKRATSFSSFTPERKIPYFTVFGVNTQNKHLRRYDHVVSWRHAKSFRYVQLIGIAARRAHPF
jgi:hypothetical protein